MDPIRFTDRHFPLLCTAMPARIDADSLSDYTARFEAYYARGQRFATLVDTRGLEALPRAVDRARLAEWQNLTIELIGRYNVVNVTVVGSAVIRGAMTALNWVFRPPNEQLVVSDFGDGFALCVDRLRREALSFPPSLEALARLGTRVTVEDVFRLE